MAKKHKILGAIAGLVGVAVIATGVYFAVPKIVNKSWGEILHIGEEKPPAEKSKLTLNTNGNLTFICADDKGTTYTEEELEAKEWQGETLTFTLAPNDGYMLWSTKVNGAEIPLDNNMFTVTIDKDTTIDVEVQEIKEYTANIVEDRYSQWQLTVNGEPLNSGDTIRTGDLISGRVISLTSGYKTGTFLVNDIEYVQNLDKYGFIQENIRIENSENEEVRFSTSTVRDTSSNIISFNRLDTQGIINTPAYFYTSEICSVYNITTYGIRVGEEVKMDFTILNTELFGGITLNGESLEVTTAEDGVSASCIFTVPADECTLELVKIESAFEPYTITFDVDPDLTVRSVASWQIVDGTMTITEQPTTDTFTIRITALGSHTGEDLVVIVDGEEYARTAFELGSAYEFEIPYTTEDVSIYFEENNILPFQFDEGTLVSYTGTSSDLVIPESYSVDDEGNFIVGDDILITEIKDYAFTSSFIDNLTSITIPNTITKIGNWAFSYCRNLTSITIPASVTQIGINPFEGCEKLETVNIDPGNVDYKIENGCLIETYTNTLKSCLLGLNLQSLTIPDGISTIAREAFRGCGLTNITMPHSLRIIEREAFKECSNLQNIDIPNGVESIGSNAFIYCEKLISVTIPESVIQIDSTPFRYCKDLTNIIIDESNTNYKMENNCLIEIVSNTVLQGLNVSSITVPETVKRIGMYAFDGCEKLISITLPEGLTSIDSSAFARTSLTSITVPSTVTDVAYSFCGECETLTEIIMLPTNPPSCRGFNNVPSSVIMYVQDESIETYLSTSGWDELNRYGVTTKGLSEREVV